MLEARDTTEAAIWWETTSGNASFWHDNWTRLGSFINHMPLNFQCDLSIEDVNEAIQERH